MGKQLNQTIEARPGTNNRPVTTTRNIKKQETTTKANTSTKNNRSNKKQLKQQRQRKQQKRKRNLKAKATTSRNSSFQSTKATYSFINQPYSTSLSSFHLHSLQFLNQFTFHQPKRNLPIFINFPV